MENPALCVEWVAAQNLSNPEIWYVATKDALPIGVDGRMRVALVLKDIQRNLAEHIVDLHNAMIARSSGDAGRGVTAQDIAAIEEMHAMADKNPPNGLLRSERV